MTNEQILVLISIIVAGITGLGTIVTGVRGYFWSKDYRESKQAEIDAKEAGYVAKESEYKTQLETKEERIRLLSLIVDPEYTDKVEEKLDEQKSNIKKLQDTIQQLNDQLSEANSRIETLKTEIGKLSISDTERSSLRVFTAGSSTSMGDLFKTAKEITTVSGEIEKSTFDPSMFPSKINLKDILFVRTEDIGTVNKKTGESHDDELPAGVEEE
jgi:uncharacterized coiled-coil DUF342 family protein